MLVAHNKMAERNGVIMAILREMVAAEGSGMSCMPLGVVEVIDPPEAKDRLVMHRIAYRHSLYLVRCVCAWLRL